MHTPSILEYSWKRDKKSLSFTLNTFKCDRFESLLPVEQNVFFSLICMLCSNLAEDVGPLPLAVDRRGLDDELDLGQIAAAGVPVHDVPSWLRSSKNADSGSVEGARISKYANPVLEGVRTLSHTRPSAARCTD